MSEKRSLYLIVDGDDLFRAPQKVAGRAPERHERLDYSRLLYYASWEVFGERAVTPIYFQREHNTAAAFYQALRGFGYDLRLSPYDDGFEVPKEGILQLLEMLRDIDCDLLYAGGDSYYGRITTALRLLLHDEAGDEPRNVAVVHFAGWRTIEDPELEYRDIVRDSKAMPESIYEGPATEAFEGTPPSIYTTVSEPSDTAGEGLGGQLATALREAGATEGPEPGNAADVPAAPPAAAVAPPAPAAAAASRANPQGSNTILLIDCENIDWHLSTMLGGKQNLNMNTRPQWTQLKRFALERAGEGKVGAAAYLQFNEQVSGFARYLEAELGFATVILEPELVDGPGGVQTRRPVVDEAINKLLTHLAADAWPGDIYVVTNDGGYLTELEAVRDAGGGGRIAVVGFTDEMHGDYARADWIETIDLEVDVGAFSYKLPRRYRPVAVDEYEPATTLADLFGDAAEDGDIEFEDAEEPVRNLPPPRPPRW